LIVNNQPHAMTTPPSSSGGSAHKLEHYCKRLPSGGWGDTFYGPAVPRCQFWQMPQFTYVRTRDGLCGVGYICVEKYSID